MIGQPTQEGQAINRQWLRGIALAAALAANSRPATRNPASAADEVRITVYDAAYLPQVVIRDALDQLRVILEQANVASHPVQGNPADPEASLFVYVAMPAKGEEPAMPCGARRDIAIRIVELSPASFERGVLGMSSPFAAFGLSVRLFDDHIREAALRYGVPHGIVLSYAIAHEIAHVLLRSGSHCQSGIMTSVWTEHEYEQMARGALMFSDDEARKMSANLLAPPCDQPNRRPAWALGTGMAGGR